jgi:preprotein translocase subunit YajC
MVHELLIGQAWAQDAAPVAASNPMALVLSYAPLILIFVIFYVLIIRPQGQAAKAHAALLAALTRGQWVATDAGLVGEVTRLLDASTPAKGMPDLPSYVRLQVADGTEVIVQRVSIKRVLTEAEVALVAGAEAAKHVSKATGKAPAKGKK